jgi:hypothetical protein
VAAMTDPVETSVVTTQVSQDSKNLALLLWIGTIFFGFIPGLIMYLVKKDDPYILDQSKEALNWAITAIIGYVAGLILTIINDKNWEGIYEGDIVQNFEPDNFVIEYSNGSFWCVGYSKGKPIVDMFEPYILSSKAVESEQLEIIGNIYENPELLS